MDITRLPVAYQTRPVSTTIKANRHPELDDAAPRVERVATRARGAGSFDDAMQGELLQRERNSYQSTRAFIDEHNLNHARPAGEPAGNRQHMRSAMLQYANNIRPEPHSELTQGVSVNYFV